MRKEDIQVGVIYNLQSLQIKFNLKEHPNPIFRGRVVEKGPCYINERGSIKKDRCWVEITDYNIGKGGPSIGRKMSIEDERILSPVENKESAKFVLTKFEED